jgi:hypothetical protein
MQDRNLPVDDVEANAIAELLREKPAEGYLTVSTRCGGDCSTAAWYR